MDQQTLSEIGLRVERVRGAAWMPEAHRHAEVEVNFIVSGRLTYWLGGGAVILEAGSLSAFWAAYPHRVVADTEDLEFYWLTVPLPHLLSWSFPQSLVDALMSGVLVRQDEVSSVEAERLLWENWKAASRNPRLSGFELDVLRWEVRARLGRFALQAAPPDIPPAPRRTTGMSRGVQKMARFIGEHFREPVRVADIAADAGLNPNYATEAFRKVFGLSLKEYLNRQRIAEAQRLLLSREDTVLEIAYQCGFASPSRFHEWFNRLCGTSPEQYRKQVRSSAN
ncbi:MAG: helix-turn-helix domain-containing protein [Oceanipulchritudo sp.]|jgi:AraC-like DNA-binding protein